MGAADEGYLKGSFFKLAEQTFEKYDIISVTAGFRADPGRQAGFPGRIPDGFGRFPRQAEGRMV